MSGKEFTTFTIEIPIKVLPKKRPRFAKGFVYTPSDTAKCENDIGYFILQKKGLDLYTSPLDINIIMTFKRPKSVSEKKRMFCSVKPDLDNLVKTVLDSMNGIVFTDDSLIVSLRASKNYGPSDSLFIEINPLSIPQT